jgi:hypothetical protein
MAHTCSTKEGRTVPKESLKVLRPPSLPLQGCNWSRWGVVPALQSVPFGIVFWQFQYISSCTLTLLFLSSCPSGPLFCHSVPSRVVMNLAMYVPSVTQTATISACWKVFTSARR